LKKLYIGNLPFTATEDELRQLFGQHGTVHSVALINDRETGRPRGFGFVEMPKADAARAIQNLNGHQMEGRALKVNLAEDRPRERNGSGRTRSAGSRPFVPAFDPGPSFFAVEGRFSKPKGSRRGARGKKRSL